MVQIAARAPAARPHEIIEDVSFEGDTTEYEFSAGPLPDLLSAYLETDPEQQIKKIVQGKFAWVRDGFDPEDWAEIAARIDDPTDPLRSESILTAYDVLIEAVSKRPPTSSTASSRARSGSQSAPKRKPRGATSGS